MNFEPCRRALSGASRGRLLWTARLGVESAIQYRAQKSPSTDRMPRSTTHLAQGMNAPPDLRTAPACVCIGIDSQSPSRREEQSFRNAPSELGALEPAESGEAPQERVLPNYRRRAAANFARRSHLDQAIWPRHQYPFPAQRPCRRLADVQAEPANESTPARTHGVVKKKRRATLHPTDRRLTQNRAGSPEASIPSYALPRRTKALLRILQPVGRLEPARSPPPDRLVRNPLRMLSWRQS